MDNWLVHHDLRAPDVRHPPGAPVRRGPGHDRLGRVPGMPPGGPVRAPRRRRRVPAVPVRVRRGRGRPDVGHPHHGVGPGAHPPRPVATAEDVAVLDIRLRRPGRAHRRAGLRGRRVRHVRRPLRRAGRAVRGEARGADRTPSPAGRPPTGAGPSPSPRRRVQRPRPFVIVGGGAPKRAARLGDAFLPAGARPRRWARPTSPSAAAWARGTGSCCGRRAPCGSSSPTTRTAVWAELGPHALHEANGYGRWAAAVPGASPYRPVDLGRRAAATRAATRWSPPTSAWRSPAPSTPGPPLQLKPLVGGLDPDVGWRSLELFADRVLPALAAPAPGP